MSVYLVAVASLGLLVTNLIWRIHRYMQYADAPGPTLARYTTIWYAWKVWQGEWEKLDIEQHRKYGKIIRVAPNIYSIDDPTAMKPIYGINSDMIKSSWYSVFGQPGITDHNLFSARTRIFHAGMRRRMAGLYSMSATKSYETFVDSTIETLCKRLDKLNHTNQAVDLQHWMQCYAFDTIGAVTYGHQFGFMESGGEDIDNLMSNIEQMLWISTITGLLSLIKVLAQPLNIITSAKVFRVISKFDRLAEQKHVASKHGQKEEELGVAEQTEPDTFWEKVKKSQEKNPEDYKKYRLWTSLAQNMVAGSDTTSIALTSFLFHSIKDPRVWRRLATELEEAINKGEVSEHITFEEAQKLNYLQYTIKEAMRIHPSTGLPMWRVVPAPGIEIAGTFFRGGTWLGINSFVAHHNRDVFGSDADEFNPDRWDPKITSKARLEAMEAYWIPFGSGSRTCIGKNIALLEMNKLIPELLRGYRFELIEPTTGPLKTENNWFVKQKNVLVKIRKNTSK